MEVKVSWECSYCQKKLGWLTGDNRTVLESEWYIGILVDSEDNDNDESLSELKFVWWSERKNQETIEP